MEGEPCAETADCNGGLVCESGICTQVVAPAPVVSQRGIYLILGLLLSIGAFAIWRLRTTS
jgi:hypothetical protein